jgi:hypothetical protein
MGAPARHAVIRLITLEKQGWEHPLKQPNSAVKDTKPKGFPT